MSDRCQGCKMLRMTVWLCIMILNGSVTLSGSPFDCLWHSFLVNLRIWDDWWKLLYQNCNFRNMLLVPRNLSAIFRSRSSLLYTGTTGPCLDEMSPPLKRVYPLMRCLLLDGRVPPWWDVPPDEQLPRLFLSLASSFWLPPACHSHPAHYTWCLTNCRRGTYQMVTGSHISH